MVCTVCQDMTVQKLSITTVITLSCTCFSSCTLYLRRKLGKPRMSRDINRRLDNQNTMAVTTVVPKNKQKALKKNVNIFTRNKVEYSLGFFFSRLWSGGYNKKDQSSVETPSWGEL